MKKSVLITGAGGQDAYFLSKYLNRNSELCINGISNHDYSNNLGKGSLKFFDNFYKISLDSHAEIKDYISETRPSYIFNFGAVAGSLTQFEKPLNLVDINSLSVLNILETIKIKDLNTKLIQASSSEVFVSNHENKQDINSFRKPRTIYGASKIFSDTLIDVYRTQFGIDCFSVVLFSHESPLRKDVFFSKKIVNQIFDFMNNKISKIKVYTPYAQRDWGYAGDYCKYIAKKALVNNKKDLLVGSGKPHTVKDFTIMALSYFNLDYNEVVEEVEMPSERALEEDYVFLDPSYMDKDLYENITYDLDKLVKLLMRHKMYSLCKRGKIG
ncbi:MAG: GDP-mannose 4,6-dehydratase [Gammaproteobacteria bacterium]